jgi:hypothetical protein
LTWPYPPCHGDYAFAAEGVGHLRDGSAYGGGGLLAGGHRHVGGAEIDLPGAERGDARAAAHGGVSNGHARVLLLVPGEGHGEERRIERRAGPGEGGSMTGGAVAGYGPADAAVLMLDELVQAPTARRMNAAVATVMTGRPEGQGGRPRCVVLWHGCPSARTGAV